MITVLGGSSGSGKSYVAYTLLREYPHEPVMWPAATPPNRNKTKAKIVGYTLPGDLFVAGPYTARACGGADSLHGGFPKVQLPFLERACAKFTHVFIESLMASLCKMDDWTGLVERLTAANAPSMPIIFPTMNTGQEMCLQRIYQRNGGKPINEGATHSNWRRVQRRRVALEEAGFYAPYVDHTRSYDHVIEILKWGGWQP